MALAAEHVKYPVQNGMHVGIAGMGAGKGGKQIPAQLLQCTLGQRNHQPFAAFEMMQNGGVRNADICGNILQADAFGPMLRQAPLGGVQNDAPRLLGGAPYPFDFPRYCHNNRLKAKIPKKSRPSILMLETGQKNITYKSDNSVLALRPLVPIQEAPFKKRVGPMQNETVQIGQDTRIRPLVAIRALRALFKNKEDTGQVFKIVAALTGNSMQKILQRFRASPVGAAVLAENRQLLSTLSNREYLRSLPEASFGRIYQQFLETEGLSAEGLVDASRESPQWEKRKQEFETFSSRLRDSHDLQHVVTGYGRDALGELCVLAFSYAHTRNRGIGFLVLMGMFKFKKDLPRGVPVFRAVREAYRNGARAVWFPGVDWEAMLKLPLEEVRRTLNIMPPVIYKSAQPRMIELEAEYQRNMKLGAAQAA